MGGVGAHSPAVPSSTAWPQVSCKVTLPRAILAAHSGAANIIGHGLNGGPLFQNSWGMALAHGISQGVVSQLRGGSFKCGFIGAIVGGLSPAGAMTRLGIGNVLTRTVVASVFGGLASWASGGSFEDGAMAAAFRH